MIPLWAGSANTWDCDEMGHMNVRVYMEKAEEGLGSLAHALGLPQAYQPGSASTLLPCDQHIRFIHEVRPGRPLTMTGCVLEWDACSVLVYQDLRHGDGRPAAAFRTRLQHVNATTGLPFAWNRSTRERLDRLVDTPPQDTRPRGLDLDISPVDDRTANINTVLDGQSPEIGRTLVLPQHCDAHGRLYPSAFMGRISDAVPNLLYDWRRKVAGASPGTEMGAAVVEYRLIYRRWPRAGDLMTLHSALAEANEKTHRLCHWMMDPVSGQAWLTSEAVALTFDLVKRKVIPTPADELAALAKMAPGSLRL